MSLNLLHSADAEAAPVAGTSALRDVAFALMRHACAGHHAAAQAALEQLFCWRGRFPAYALLQELASGKLRCHASAGVFVLGEQQLTPTMQANFADAIAQCQAFLDLPAPCILLQCKAETRDLHLSIESFPGLATMRLSSMSDGFPDDLRAVQFHEVAHCFLTCGVRLLDEGLAQLFASRHAGASLPAADPALLPPMRSLLSRAADSMFGASADSDLAVYKAACRAGADLLERIYRLGGAARVTRLFADVARCTSDRQIVQLVELASEQHFPQAIAQADDNPEHQTLIRDARAAIFGAWERKDPAELTHIIAQLEAQAVFTVPALLDALLGARLNLALLQANYGTKPGREQEAQLDVLLKAADCLPPGRIWLWRGTRAILAILLAKPNIIKVAGAGQQALQALNKAQELIPDDPDLLVQHASLLWHAPAEYGGDRDLAVGKLRLAMQDPAYRDHARYILLDYGVDVGDGQDTIAAGAASSASASASADAIVEVEHLQLRLSPSFCLQPGSFTLGRHEKVALIGRNGSGKSMLLETLLGLRRPDSGRIHLHLGLHPGSGGDAIAQRQQIGGLLQGADWPGLTRVREIMALHRVMYARTEVAVTRALGLDELAERSWQQLSRGQKQRVMLWLALAHVPELVLLDEPTLGLDEWFARALRELLQKLPTSLLIVSHLPADLAGMDRLLCLDDGKIVDQGTLAELVARHAGAYCGRISQELDAPAVAALQALPELLRPAQQREGRWEMAGKPGFDQGFRRFIDQHHIRAFSLEAATAEDFLAHFSHD